MGDEPADAALPTEDTEPPVDKEPNHPLTAWDAAPFVAPEVD